MKRAVLLDGAVGTSLWELADRAGINRDPVWKYNMEHPELVQELHRQMIEAGAEIILANTFGANEPMVKRCSSYTVEEVVKKGVELAKMAAEGTGVKVAVSCGPLSELLEPFGDLEEEEAERIFRNQIGSGIEAGADLVMIQTFIDLEMMKIAAKVAKSYAVPVFCTLSFEKVGKTMMGQSVEQVCRELEALGVDGVGMNCSLGPEYALPVIEEFSRQTKLPLVFKPNAGMPGQTTDPESFAKIVAPAAEFVSYVGGCCNCNADYVKALKKYL
ncbi:MAG: homocysteine S-methyltransferase family protein [Eubacteriales bacterium]|nr:homocysteine S-methyltransferase family protein [Eubacteriales bacterium]